MIFPKSNAKTAAAELNEMLEKYGGVGVLLLENNKFLSRLIRWQTRSAHSHSAIYIDGKVYEAVWPKVRVLSLAEFLEDYNQSFINVYVPCYPFSNRHYQLSNEKKEKLAAFLNKQLGKKYDLTMVLRFLTRRQESRKSRNQWFCSELVAAAFEKAGFSLLSRIEPWEVSPKMLSISPLLKEITIVYPDSTIDGRP